MERDLVEAGQRAQPRDIVGDDGMELAQHRSEIGHLRDRLGDHAFIGIIAEQVDAVGAGQIVEIIAVEIGDGDARALLDEGADAKVRLHMGGELERHAIAAGELQIGQAGPRFGGKCASLGKTLSEQMRQPLEPLLAFRDDIIGRAIAAEEFGRIIFDHGNPARDAARPFGMAGQRAVLGLGQKQAATAGGSADSGRSRRDESERPMHDSRYLSFTTGI